MKNNKKAVFYSVIILMFTIFILIASLWVVFKKTTHEKRIGQEPIELLKKYSSGEGVLFYVDQAGKYSVYEAAYKLAEKGAYFNKPMCGSSLEGSKEYMMWESFIQDEESKENKDIECYPSKKDISKNFEMFLNNQLNGYLDKQTSGLIPKDNYDFYFKEESNIIKIEAIAARNVIIPLDKVDYKERTIPTLSNEEKQCVSENNFVFLKREKGEMKYRTCTTCPEDGKCERYMNEVYCNIDSCNFGCLWKNGKCAREEASYAVKPSFKTEMSYNFIGRFSEYANRTKDIRDSIKNCLLKGSGKPDDDDLTTCSDVGKLKKEIEGIKDYKIQIEPISSNENYTLLFDIEEDFVDNIYSEEKLVIKLGIRFRDVFPPPATEIIGIEEREEKEGQKAKYLAWKKNNASDVVSYDIYFERIEKLVGGGRTKKPTSINEMKKIEIPIQTEPVKDGMGWKIDYEKTALEDGGDYYFYIIAHDNAGNSADGNSIEPVELTI